MIRSKKYFLACLLILSSGVVFAQYQGWRQYQSYDDFPCVREALIVVGKHLPDLLPTSAAIFLHFKVGQDGEHLMLTGQEYFTASSHDLPIARLDSLFSAALSLIESDNCNEVPGGEVILPLAIPHPAVGNYHPSISTDFRRLPAARRLFHQYHSDSSTTVHRVYEVDRVTSWIICSGG